MIVRGLRAKSLVFVDPGKRACAVAHWKGGVFRSARLIETLTSVPLRRTFTEAVSTYLADHTVIECPQVYPHGAGKGEDPNDLIQVALSAGACAGACVSAEYVFPGTWKGQVPKEIHHRRVLARSDYTPAMAAAVAAVAPTLRHNVLDAIALGLWWLDTHPT